MGQTVYVVTEGDYSAYHICGISLDREKAEHISALCGGWQIEEWTLDEPLDPTIMHDYQVTFFPHRHEQPSVGLAASVGYVRVDKFDRIHRPFKDNPDWLEAYVHAFTEEQAKKIAQDLLAEYKARVCGIT